MQLGILHLIILLIALVAAAYLTYTWATTINKLFENQGSLSDSYFKQLAADLGLNTEQFNTCVDTQKYADEVDKDFQDGAAAGGSGTPTAFVNGQKIGGAQPYSVFQAAIEQALAA